MGLLKKMFDSNKTSQKEEKQVFVNWIPLRTLEQLDKIATLSKTETVVIFKHSTRCGISRNVLKMFEKSFDKELSKLKVYYLDLLNYRAISDEIAKQFHVIHQSPQLLVIKNEVVVVHASHYDIMAIDLKGLIN